MKNLRWRIAQYFELRWWRNYLQGKNKTEYLQWKKNYWQNLLLQVGDVLVITPTDTVADLGCGPAGMFVALPQNKITAVDPLLDAYEKQLLFFDKSDYPNTTFIKSTIEDFRAPQKFDLVFCMNAINHVRNIDKAYDVLANQLKQGGKIVVSIDAHNHSFFKHLFRLIPGDILHPHQYNLDEYNSFLQKRGIGILKTTLVKKGFFFNHYLVAGEK